MRRWCALWSACCLLLLSGCDSAQVTPAIGSGFRCHIGILFEDLRLHASLKRDACGALTMVASEPDTIKGLRMAWDGVQLTFALGELQLAAAPERLPSGALVLALCETLDDCDGRSGHYDGDSATIEGDGTNGAFTLTYDQHTGLPQTLTIPDLELTVCFSEFELTE